MLQSSLNKYKRNNKNSTTSSTSKGKNKKSIINKSRKKRSLNPKYKNNRIKVAITLSIG